jgi:tRNA threonylcarbamoyladenosine biosynthesis protein TsaE
MDRRLSAREDTLRFGKEFARCLKAGDVVTLHGELGAGKTTLVQGILEGLGIQDMAQSPTFTYLHTYEGAVPVHHFDLYRLNSERDFLALGFEEFLHDDAIVLIEWPERVEKIVTPTWRIRLSHAAPSGRTIEVCQC